MNPYIISCCSTADLSKSHIEEREIHFIPFHYEINGETLKDDLGQTLTMDNFYKQMTQGATVKTSQINAEEYGAYFRSFLENGYDILHITLSSGISGTINSAHIAQAVLQEEFPERTIYVIDSLCASAGYGLLMDMLVDLKNEGMDIHTLANWCTTHRTDVMHQFFSTDLTYYIKGGRVSKTSGTIGNLLNICPLLCINQEGKLIVEEKVRTKKKVIHRIVEKMKETAKDGENYNGQCYISHSACLEDAKAVADLITSTFSKLTKPIQIYEIGTVIGCHTGPGTVAVFYLGQQRTV